MLGLLVKNLVGLIRETYDVAETSVLYLADDIAGIPDAAIAGWNDGLFTHTPEIPTMIVVDDEPDEITIALRA